MRQRFWWLVDIWDGIQTCWGRLSDRSLSSNKVAPPSSVFQPQPLGWDRGDGRVKAFMWGPPPEGLCPSALHGCLLHIDSKEKMSLWVTVVKLESICHTVFRAWASWTALWQDSNVSYLLGLSVIWGGYCMAALAFTFCPWGYVRVGAAVLKFYSLCVWGRKGVGARPRPDSWESWPADLAACPRPHQQSKRWDHTSHQFSFQLRAAFFSGSGRDKMTPVLILSVFVTHLTHLPWASLLFSDWDKALASVFDSLFPWPLCHDITLQADQTA